MKKYLLTITAFAVLKVASSQTPPREVASPKFNQNKKHADKSIQNTGSNSSDSRYSIAKGIINTSVSTKRKEYIYASPSTQDRYRTVQSKK